MKLPSRGSDRFIDAEIENKFIALSNEKCACDDLFPVALRARRFLTDPYGLLEGLRAVGPPITTPKQR
jgi:hypothetical protein